MTKPNGSEPSNYFADFERMRGLLADLYTALEAQEWLLAKNKLLSDQSPADLIAQGKTAEVERLIDQLASGAYL
jgi:uncharacterized protein (DUF2384 family)